MKPIKSAVTFFRKQLGFTGNSQHNGRGVYEMDVTGDVSKTDVEARIRQCIAKWQAKNLVENVTENDRFLTVTLKDELFVPSAFSQYTKSNQSYRQLCFGKYYGNLGVTMCF